MQLNGSKCDASGMPRTIEFRLVSAWWLTVDNSSMRACWMSEIDSFRSFQFVFSLAAFKAMLFN